MLVPLIARFAGASNPPVYSAAHQRVPVPGELVRRAQGARAAALAAALRAERRREAAAAARMAAEATAAEQQALWEGGVAPESPLAAAAKAAAATAEDALAEATGLFDTQPDGGDSSEGCSASEAGSDDSGDGGDEDESAPEQADAVADAAAEPGAASVATDAAAEGSGRGAEAAASAEELSARAARAAAGGFRGRRRRTPPRKALPLTPEEEAEAASAKAEGSGAGYRCVLLRASGDTLSSASSLEQPWDFILRYEALARRYGRGVLQLCSFEGNADWWLRELHSVPAYLLQRLLCCSSAYRRFLLLCSNGEQQDLFSTNDEPARCDVFRPIPLPAQLRPAEEELPPEEAAAVEQSGVLFFLDTVRSTVTLPEATGFPPFSGPPFGEPVRSDADGAAALAALKALQALGEAVFLGKVPEDPELRAGMERARELGRRGGLPAAAAEAEGEAPAAVLAASAVVGVSSAAGADGSAALAAAAAAAAELYGGAGSGAADGPPWPLGTLVQFRFRVLSASSDTGPHSEAEGADAPSFGFAAIEIGYGGAARSLSCLLCCSLLIVQYD